MIAKATRARRPAGLPLVLGATAVSALGSFVVLLIVAPALGPEGYASFSVYWATLFMIVGVLFGLQQEGTRAVAAAGDPLPLGSRAAGASLLVFGAATSVALVAVVAATSPLWGPALFGPDGSGWILPLVVAVAGYAVVAALNGVLAGAGAWGPFALLPVVDSVLRLVLVAWGIAAGGGGLALAWAVAIPFPVSLVVVLIVARRTVSARARVAERFGRLAANTARTAVAAAATAVLVTGFPVVLQLLGRSDPATLGTVVLAVMLTRAPILVPLMALQSMLIARFGANPAGRSRLLRTVLLGLLAVTGLLAVLAFLVGEPLLVLVFGADFALGGALLAGLVVSAGCLGVLTVTGAAVLSAGHHSRFAAGWLLASAVAVLLVAVAPGDLGGRTVLALSLGPLLGAALHAWGAGLRGTAAARPASLDSSRSPTGS